MYENDIPTKDELTALITKQDAEKLNRAKTIILAKLKQEWDGDAITFDTPYDLSLRLRKQLATDFANKGWTIEFLSSYQNEDLMKIS